MISESKTIISEPKKATIEAKTEAKVKEEEKKKEDSEYEYYSEDEDFEKAT